LFPNPSQQEASWFARHAVLPINHMVVVKQELSEQNPDAVREVHRLLREAAKDARPRFPENNIRRSLTMIIDYTAQQGLIPRALTVDELFDDVTRPLFERMPQQ
jgi:4,5-dihydroxyphthalate decarboxylase